MCKKLIYLVSCIFVLSIAAGAQANPIPVSVDSSVESVIGADALVPPGKALNTYDLQVKDFTQGRRVTLISFDIEGLTTDIQWLANMKLSVLGGNSSGSVDVYGVIEDQDNISGGLTWKSAPGVNNGQPTGYPVDLDEADLTDKLLSFTSPKRDERNSAGSAALDDFINSDTDGVVTLLLAPAKKGTNALMKSNKYSDGGVILEGEIISPTAAMVVNDVNLPAGLDAAQKDRLESMGYAVTVTTGSDVSDGVFTAADAETFDVLVVSESIGSSQANNLIGANVPMMHQESYGWSRHFFTQGLGKTWLNDPAGEVNIVDDTHQIVTDAGLAAGQVAFFTDPNIAWTTDTVESLVVGADNIAQITNADGVAYTIIFAIEAGMKLADPNMLAANRICCFSLPGQDMLAADVMTDDAWALFDASIAWLDPLEPPSRAAMVVNDATLPAGLDAAMKDRLKSLGYAITITTGSDVSDGIFTAEYAETFDVLVVSESIGSSQANNLIGANVPMMHQESYGWSRHFFTLGLGKTWLNDPNGEINIVDDTHQIVTDAGLAAGQVAFFTDPSNAWTTDTVESLVAGAVNIAQIANADGVAYTIIFTIEAGTELADASLAANRVCGFSLPGQGLLAADVMTDDAWALFDSSIAWLDQ